MYPQNKRICIETKYDSSIFSRTVVPDLRNVF